MRKFRPKSACNWRRCFCCPQKTWKPPTIWKWWHIKGIMTDLWYSIVKIWKWLSWGWQKTHKTKRKYKTVLEKLKWTRLEDRRHLGERARKRGGAHRSEETRHGVDVYGARRSARSSSGERRRAAAAGRGQRSDICDFFFTAKVSEPRRSHVGEAKKKRHSPDIGIRRVVLVPVSDTTPKMACPCNLVKI